MAPLPRAPMNDFSSASASGAVAHEIQGSAASQYRPNEPPSLDGVIALQCRGRDCACMRGRCFQGTLRLSIALRGSEINHTRPQICGCLEKRDFPSAPHTNACARTSEWPRCFARASGRFRMRTSPSNGSFAGWVSGNNLPPPRLRSQTAAL